jgi:hypothetical protein
MGIPDLEGKVDLTLAFARVQEFPTAGHFFAEVARVLGRCWPSRGTRVTSCHSRASLDLKERRSTFFQIRSKKFFPFLWQLTTRD